MRSGLALVLDGARTNTSGEARRKVASRPMAPNSSTVSRMIISLY